jgi:hypothetical protein
LKARCFPEQRQGLLIILLFKAKRTSGKRIEPAKTGPRCREIGIESSKRAGAHTEPTPTRAPAQQRDHTARLSHQTFSRHAHATKLSRRTRKRPRLPPSCAPKSRRPQHVSRAAMKAQPAQRAQFSAPVSLIATLTLCTAGCAQDSVDRKSHSRRRPEPPRPNGLAPLICRPLTRSRR